MNDLKLLENDALSAAEQARGLVIRNDTDLSYADEFQVNLLGLENKIKEHYAPIKQSAFNHHRMVCGEESKNLEPVSEARKVLRQKIGTYKAEAEGRRRGAEEQLRLEAQKRAETALLAQAESREASGDKEGAERILGSPMPIQAVVLPKLQTQTKLRTLWRAEITNMDEFLRAEQNRPYFLPDISALNKFASATKGALKLPGVRIFSVEV